MRRLLIVAVALSASALFAGGEVSRPEQESKQETSLRFHADMDTVYVPYTLKHHTDMLADCSVPHFAVTVTAVSVLIAEARLVSPVKEVIPACNSPSRNRI